MHLCVSTVVSCCEVVWGGEDERGVGGKVVSGGGDGLVKLWDLQDGREVLSMAGHTAEVVRTLLCLFIFAKCKIVALLACTHARIDILIEGNVHLYCDHNVCRYVCSVTVK